jgi:hypothetical protein
MRNVVDPSRKHQAFGISFPPELRAAARKRAFSLEINFSRYLQHLVEADLGISPLPSLIAESGNLRSQSRNSRKGKQMNSS